MRPRIVILCLVLVAANVAAWIWAGMEFADQPAMMGTALLAYGLGLRHAVDADHIAAIDNVTRKLMEDGQRPIDTGLWFAIGHSSIVLIASIGIALVANAVSQIEAFGSVGGIVATIVSATFLLAIAAMNLFILNAVWRAFQTVRNGGGYVQQDLDMMLVSGGLLARLFRPLFKMVRKSWHMAPLGFLFGLGFDTATEVAILGLSATHAGGDASLSSVLVLPALFAAGMALIDTADGLLMTGAYEWAFVKPVRKLYYNITITLVSAMVAVVIGSIQVGTLMAEKLNLHGAVWGFFADVSTQFNNLGFGIIGLFIVSWTLSFAIYRFKRFDEIEAHPRNIVSN